ncbi:hypothetical protein M0802_009733 [Mischocyttarus mexicanus]|nr:hypothetical protein M0802_009733 [Mischocyttarus mexicanus]
MAHGGGGGGGGSGGDGGSISGRVREREGRTERTSKSKPQRSKDPGSMKRLSLRVIKPAVWFVKPNTIFVVSSTLYCLRVEYVVANRVR